MKVAYVCADAGVPIFGTKGCSIHVQEIVRAFLQRGDSVDLYVARVGGEPPADLTDCQVHEFPLARCTSVADREIAQQQLANSIGQSIPMDEYDLVYERYSLWSETSQILAERNQVRSILEVNAPLIEEQHSHRHLIDRTSAECIARNAFRHAHSVVTVSTEVANYVSSFYVQQTGIVLPEVKVVPNGVDVSRFHPDVRPIDACDDFTIGFVGSLKPWHGVDTLIAAFLQLVEIHPDSRLRIIGDGPMRETLEHTLKQNSAAAATRTEFVGAVSPTEMPRHLTSLDVAVAPYSGTSDFYFSPLKVYEYMACGLPVVAGAIGQLTELIDDGINGLLYEPGRIDQLTQCLARLQKSRSLRGQLATNARDTVVRHHSWQQCLERILQQTTPATA